MTMLHHLVTAQLLFLEAEDPKKEIYLYIIVQVACYCWSWYL